MNTVDKFIYYYQPKNGSSYFLVRFRRLGKYQQKVFVINSINGNKSEMLAEAIKYRDEHSKGRELNERNLLSKPLKNKEYDLPVGISFSNGHKKHKRRSYRYPSLIVTAGYNDGKLIQKRIYLSAYSSYDKAVQAAKEIRNELAIKYKKRSNQ